MSVTLITTVGDPNANSYVTRDDVQSYIESHFVQPPISAKWDQLSDDQKSAALIRATQLLDRHVEWVGEISTDEQALSWPRAFAYDRYGRDIESTIIPLFIKEFQIETALWVIDQSGSVPESTVGEYDSIKVGSIEVNFNEVGATKRQSLPDIVISGLSPMGKYTAATLGGIQTVKLVRS